MAGAASIHTYCVFMLWYSAFCSSFVMVVWGIWGVLGVRVERFAGSLYQ